MAGDKPKKPKKSVYEKLKKKIAWKRKRPKRTEEERMAYVEAAAKRMSEEESKTWPEEEFEKLLNEVGIEFTCQKIIGRKIFDYYLPKYNMVVEVDGDYYHGNPDTNKGRLNKMQNRNRKVDRFKNELALKNGYKIERIWENSLKKDYENQVLRFKQLLR